MAAKEKGGDTCPICFDPLKVKEVWNISEQYEGCHDDHPLEGKNRQQKTTGI